jgi:hypothetical protein
VGEVLGVVEARVHLPPPWSGADERIALEVGGPPMPGGEIGLDAVGAVRIERQDAQLAAGPQHAVRLAQEAEVAVALEVLERAVERHTVGRLRPEGKRGGVAADAIAVHARLVEPILAEGATAPALAQEVGEGRVAAGDVDVHFAGLRLQQLRGDEVLEPLLGPPRRLAAVVVGQVAIAALVDVAPELGHVDAVGQHLDAAGRELRCDVVAGRPTGVHPPPSLTPDAAPLPPGKRRRPHPCLLQACFDGHRTLLRIRAPSKPAFSQARPPSASLAPNDRGHR